MTLFRCPRCGESKPSSGFHKDKHRANGITAYCAQCRNERFRQEVPKNRAYHTERVRRERAANPRGQRAAARRQAELKPKAVYAIGVIRNEIKRGRLQRQPCEVCGNKYSHGHHDDYDKPLSVRWLCPVHHAEWHNANGPGANIEGQPVLVGRPRKTSTETTSKTGNNSSEGLK